ncbi:MAG: sensor histidine kinase [Eubacteriales bacterium]
MIYNLRKKFIRISVLSLLAVFLLMGLATYFVCMKQLSNEMDALTDTISANNGRFPDWDPKRDEFPNAPGNSRFINRESQFTTRFFTVRQIAGQSAFTVNIKSTASVTEEDAIRYAQQALAGEKTRGWISNFRYKVNQTDDGISVVFVDGSVARSTSNMLMLTVFAILIGSASVILLLIVLFSKRAVKPVAESYEKQKQFITDANHELKTPLTLILTNLDIAESEMGQNEWLDDIRCEGERMNALINQLVALSRMDEAGSFASFESFNFSDAAEESVSQFRPLAEKQNKEMIVQIEPGLSCIGDESAIRHLMSVLLDNAVKYCDEAGTISVVLKRKRNLILTVENTCRDVGKLPLNRLFDRFYRSDPARTYTGSFGIGLSIAKAIVEKHKGEISAYRKDAQTIGFRVVLK